MLPSEPLLQPSGLDIDPPTHPQIHRCIVGSLFDRNEAERSVNAEAGLGGHRSGIQHANNSRGPVVEEHPEPNQQDLEVHG